MFAVVFFISSVSSKEKRTSKEEIQHQKNSTNEGHNCTILFCSLRHFFSRFKNRNLNSILIELDRGLPPFLNSFGSMRLIIGIRH